MCREGRDPSEFPCNSVMDFEEIPTNKLDSFLGVKVRDANLLECCGVQGYILGNVKLISVNLTYDSKFVIGTVSLYVKHLLL